jgi:maleylpyruvate isomerase
MRDEAMLDTVDVSTDLLLASVEALRDDEVTGPTLLPEWHRGHLLTHVARGADSLGRLLEWARTGVEQQQYPSSEARAAEIQSGSRRSIDELAADITRTAAAFEQAVRSLPDAAWSVVVRPRTGEPATAERLVFIRLRELEMHHVDLAAGYAFADIPPEVTTLVIDDILASHERRPDSGPRLRISATDVTLERELGSGGPLVTGDQADLLGWLSGRTDGAALSLPEGGSLPQLPAWI